MYGCYFLITVLAIVQALFGGFVFTQFVTTKSAVRLRLSDGIFVQISRLVDSLYQRRVMQLVIANEQQCFIEGCVQIYALRITAHRPPTFVVVAPSPPNLLTLTIADFDLYITGSVSGQLQLVPPIPISVPASGTLDVVATQMEVDAVLDIQKSANDKPFLRLVSCYVRKGNINTKIENMGLITSIVNLKYQNEMNDKSEEVLQRTVCGNVLQIIEGEFNARIAKVPSRVSVKDIAALYLKDKSKRRSHRAVQGTSGSSPHGHNRVRKPKLYHAHSAPTVLSAAVNGAVDVRSAVTVPSHSRAIPVDNNFSLDKFSSIILSLSVLDASATYDKFFIGLNGDVFVVDHAPIKNPYRRPENLKFVTSSKGNSIELLLSEYTVNTLLLNAHVIGATAFRVGSRTEVFGKLLRTTCSLDEVCLSDSVPEPGEKYPNRQLEMVIRTVKAPVIRLTHETATINMEGLAMFYLEGTTEKIGTIPFVTTAVVKARTKNGRIYGSLSIPSLEIKKDVNFFELPADSLGGFRDATKGALEKLANEKLKDGIPMETNDDSNFHNPSIVIVNGAFLVQSDFDLEKVFYSTPTERTFTYYWSRI